MGYNARNDEIRDNVTRMRADWKAQRQALVTVRRFSATLSANGYVWFWPKVAARGDDQTPLTGDCRRQLPHGCGSRPWEERIDEPATN